MNTFLKQKRVLGYVNGDLKDHGPKGELQDSWKYSEEPAWSERADKQVMNFIMASLNDIPKNMVKEMKTTKELWDTHYNRYPFWRGHFGPFDIHSCFVTILSYISEVVKMFV